MDGWTHSLPVSTTMTKEKTTVLSEGNLVFNDQSFFVKGYEIHMGETKMTKTYHHLSSFLIVSMDVKHLKIV